MSDLALVTSDIHIHKYKQFNQNNRRLDNGIKYLDYLFEFCGTNIINLILIPGDLYNLMQIVSTEVEDRIIGCLSDNFKKYPRINIVAISGNHDHATKNLIDSPAVSALSHLATVFKGRFFLLDEPTSFYVTEQKNAIYGVPYYEYGEHFRKVLEQTSKNFSTVDNNRFLLTHQMVDSGIPGKDHIEATDPLFDDYSMVFNGHLHGYKEVTEKFINVGSPMHRDQDDLGKEKGMWLVDLNDPDNTLTFVPTHEKFPQFISKEEGSELTEWEEQQYVIWYPRVTEKTVKEREMLTNFRTDLAPDTIIKNYADAAKLADAYLNYGLNILK